MQTLAPPWRSPSARVSGSKGILTSAPRGSKKKQDEGELRYEKILEAESPADLMTKYLVRDKIDKCMSQLSQSRLEGRAVVGFELQGANVQ